MIKFLNRLINFLIKTIMYITFCVAFLIWLLMWIPLFLIYKENRVQPTFFNHPNLVLLTMIIAINNFYKKFIF
jgi:hypothetical protein